MLSMFSMVWFSRRLSRTSGHARPFSLSTSFCGSIKTTAVSLLSMFTVLLHLIRGAVRLSPASAPNLTQPIQLRRQFLDTFVALGQHSCHFRHFEALRDMLRAV